MLSTNVESISLSETYGKEHEHESVIALFPEDGCINFGYWKDGVHTPITLPERVESQKEMYQQLFAAAQLKATDTVVEIGCGRGRGVSWGSVRVQDYMGIDILPEQVQKAQELFPLLKDQFLVGSAENTGLPDGQRDVVLAMESPQHFPDFYTFAKEANRVLTERGRIALSTFFYIGDSGEKNCHLHMPSGPLALDHTIQIEQAKAALEKNGFVIDKIESIGAKVFEGFCTWAKQIRVSTPHTLKWVDMYNQGYMDYYTIIAHKA